MAKKVFYNDEAREKVLAGAKVLADAVKTTMGPKGRNVVYDMQPSINTFKRVKRLRNLSMLQKVMMVRSFTIENKH